MLEAGGQILVTGYSREAAAPQDHEEEAALAKLSAADPRLPTELILAAGIRWVVFAWREPELFADCIGAESLRAAGVHMRELPELAEQVREINTHLFVS